MRPNMDGSTGCGCEQEIRNQIARELRRELYKKLADLHVGCEFQDSPENECNCALSQIVEIASGQRPTFVSVADLDYADRFRK